MKPSLALRRSGNMVIHPHIPKQKKRKPNAKQRALRASWEDLLKKYDVKPEVRKSSIVAANYSPPPVFRRESMLDTVASLDTGVGIAPKRERNTYTGDAMIGIGQLHKSNAIPIFQAEDAVDIAKMRRG